MDRHSLNCRYGDDTGGKENWQGAAHDKLLCRQEQRGKEVYGEGRIKDRRSLR